MQTTINLQDPFTYSVIPLIIAINIFVIVTCYLIFTRKTKEKNEII